MLASRVDQADKSSVCCVVVDRIHGARRLIGADNLVAVASPSNLLYSRSCNIKSLSLFCFFFSLITLQSQRAVHRLCCLIFVGYGKSDRKGGWARPQESRARSRMVFIRVDQGYNPDQEITYDPMETKNDGPKRSSLY